MFPTSTDADAVKLTADRRGVVWCLEGEGMPFCSGLRVEDFADSWNAAGAGRVRVVGGPENVPLVLSLFEARRAVGPVLEVCSPLCVEGEDRSDPEMTLYRMRSYGLPPSVGGWHVFGPLDYPSYVLAGRLDPARSDLSADPETAKRWLLDHPAWPALSFVDHLDLVATAALVGLIIDPRWFVDPADPDDSGRLEQFLGLNPKTHDGLSRGVSSRRSDRCRLVLRAWDTLRPGQLGPATGRFLYRVPGRGGRKARLAASRVFLDFLRQVWLNALCAGPQAGQLFVPEYFFDRPEEAEAFRYHAARHGG